MSSKCQTGGCGPFLTPALGWALAGGWEPPAGVSNPGTFSQGCYRWPGQAQPCCGGPELGLSKEPLCSPFTRCASHQLGPGGWLQPPSQCRADAGLAVSGLW